MPKNRRTSQKDWYEKYESYLNSAAWARKRREYKVRRPWACLGCQSRQHLHLHHLTYARLGNERLTDLVPLCAECHKLVHQLVAGGQATIANGPELVQQINQGEQALEVKSDVHPRRRSKHRKHPKQQKSEPSSASSLLALPKRSLADRMAGNAKIGFDPVRRKALLEAGKLGNRKKLRTKSRWRTPQHEQG